MKTLNQIIIAVTTLLCISTFSLKAQTTATWQGGKPGRSTDWNCPANWKEGRIPDELSQVIIPAGRLFYPVIKTEVEAIDALLIQGTAQLNLLPGASLTIVNETGRLDGISIYGQIYNEGNLEIHHLENKDNVIFDHVQGNGSLYNNAKVIALK